MDIREMIAQNFPETTRAYQAMTQNPGQAFNELLQNVLGKGEQLRSSLYDTAQTAGQSVAQFQQNPLATAQQWGARLGGDVTQQVREALANSQYGMSVMPQVSQQATENAIPAMLGAITPLQTVWHGSPHVFDKFDSSKIGTGEGAQSFGHGIYVAENPGVAKDYAIALGNERRGPLASAVAGFDREVADLKMLEDVASGKSPWPNNQYGKPVSRDWVEAQIADRQDSIKTLGSLKQKLQNLNNVYKVDLPDEHIAKMLDWDKPLSEQPEIIKQLKITHQGMHQIKMIGGSDSAQGLLDYVAAHHAKVAGRTGITQADKAAASQTLLDRGVPGIKYYDAGSRGAGEGTRNYVVFDDKLLKILGRE